MSKKLLFFLIFFNIIHLSFSIDKKFGINDLRKHIYPENQIKLLKNIDNSENFKSYDFSFEVDGATEYGLISIPKTNIPKNGYPVIIIIHGHIPYNLYSTFNNYKYIFNRYAESEFVVVKPDLMNHGRSGKSSNFDENISKLFFLNDILQLLSSLKTIENLDLNNIFLMGHSNGGDTALRVLSVYPNIIRGVSLWAPVSVKLEESTYFYRYGGKQAYYDNTFTNSNSVDTINTIKSNIEMSLLKLGTESIDDIRIEKYLSQITTPIILRHSKTDLSVPYQWSIDFIDKYNKFNNNKVIFYNYEDDDHNLSKNQKQAQFDDLKLFRKLIVE